MTTFCAHTALRRRGVLLGGVAGIASSALAVSSSVAQPAKAQTPAAPAPITLPPLPTWQAFSGALTAGLPLDDAHLLLDVPEFARGPQLQITAACSLSAISKLALFAAPTPASVAVTDLKASTWQTLAIYDLQLGQLPEIVFAVPFTVNTSYIFAVVAAGKLQSVRRSVKRVT